MQQWKEDASSQNRSVNQELLCKQIQNKLVVQSNLLSHLIHLTIQVVVGCSLLFLIMTLLSRYHKKLPLVGLCHHLFILFSAPYLLKTELRGVLSFMGNHNGYCWFLLTATKLSRLVPPLLKISKAKKQKPCITNRLTDNIKPLSQKSDNSVGEEQYFHKNDS